MNNSTTFLQTVAQYYETRHAIRVAFNKFGPDIDYYSLCAQEQTALQEMLKDSSFELSLFEFFLRKAPEVAIRHLAVYYLEGDIIEDKAKYQTGLDTLLDDVREILGTEKLEQILQNTKVEVRQFYFVKRAVKEVYGVLSDEELPKWYWDA